MKQSLTMHPPYRRDDAELVQRGGMGTYWQARDGMVVQVAAREAPPRYVAPDAWMLDACAPEGGVVHPLVTDVAQAPPRQLPRIGAVGVVMALWMRLFADTA